MGVLRRILIVDDEEDIRTGLADFFRAEGLTPIEAKGGNEAYDLLARESVDVVLSDWMMSNGTGIELLMRIRQGSLQYLPFVLMSGAVTKEVLRSAIKYDPDAVLLKPFSLSALMDKITEAARNREEKEVRRLLGKV